MRGGDCGGDGSDGGGNGSGGGGGGDCGGDGGGGSDGGDDDASSGWNQYVSSPNSLFGFQVPLLNSIGNIVVFSNALLQKRVAACLFSPSSLSSMVYMSPPVMFPNLTSPFSANDMILVGTALRIP